MDTVHDAAAPAALAAYADAIEATHPQLAADMRERYGLTNTRPSLVDGVPEVWPVGGRFAYHDPDPSDAHNAVFVVMPGGAMLPLSFYNGPGDVEAAKFIIAACNRVLDGGA